MLTESSPPPSVHTWRTSWSGTLTQSLPRRPNPGGRETPPMKTAAVWPGAYRTGAMRCSNGVPGHII